MTPVADSDTILERDLKAILNRYPANARPLSAPERLGNAGGASGARLWRFESGRGRVLARCWPETPEGPAVLAARIERVHRWLADASRVGFVPVPLADLSGRTIQEQAGRFWELTPWLPGSADLAWPSRPARLRAGLAGLAAFHQSLVHRQGPRPGPSPGLIRRDEEVELWRRARFEALERALRARPASDPVAAAAGRWLALARGVAPALAEQLRDASRQAVPLQPCLRDVRPDHLLFEEDRLSGLVDFGAMDVDTVVGDLARLLGEWLAPEADESQARSARAGALAAYSAVRPLLPAEMALMDVFDRSTALLAPGNWARWHFLEGRVFDDPSVVLNGLERGLDRLARLAASAGEGRNESATFLRPGPAG